jgi:protein-S-isoprenylcysteine O-methyltransferase Ste14
MMPRAATDSAGVIAPAPILYGVAFLVGLVAEFAAPAVVPMGVVSLWLGLLTSAISIPIVISALLALRRGHTSFDARKPTTRIVSEGAFRYSRNPVYLSLTLLYIGMSLIIDSLWVLVMVVPALVLTQWGVIYREERYLEHKFGEEYRNYARSVRRWI